MVINVCGSVRLRKRFKNHTFRKIVNVSSFLLPSVLSWITLRLSLPMVAEVIIRFVLSPSVRTKQPVLLFVTV